MARGAARGLGVPMQSAAPKASLAPGGGKTPDPAALLTAALHRFATTDRGCSLARTRQRLCSKRLIVIIEQGISH